MEQFVPTGPHLQLYSPKTHSWTGLSHWHYSTIYLFFLLSGITDVVSHSPLKLPPGLDRLSLSLALLVEGESGAGEGGNKELLLCSWVGQLLGSLGATNALLEGVWMHKVLPVRQNQPLPAPPKYGSS